MENRYLALRVFLVIISITFISQGAAAVFSQDLPSSIAKVIVESSYEFTEQTRFLAKLMGTFSLAIGILTLLSAYTPARSRLVIGWLAGLLIYRGAERIFYSAEIQSVLDVVPAKNIFHASYLIFLGIALIVLFPRDDFSPQSYGE